MFTLPFRVQPVRSFSSADHSPDSLEERRKQLRETRLAARKARGLDKDTVEANANEEGGDDTVQVDVQNERRRQRSQMAQEQLSQSKGSPGFVSGYMWALLFGGGAILLYQARDYWTGTAARGVLMALRTSEPASAWCFAYLPYLVSMLPRAAATEYLIESGAVAKLLDMACVKGGADSEQRKTAVLTILCLVSPGNPALRRAVLEVPGFVPKVLDAVLLAANDIETCQTGLQILYFCIEEASFYKSFLEAKGFEIFLRGARASSAEIQGFFLHLIGLFCVSHPHYLPSIRHTIGNNDLNSIWGALTNLGAGYQETGEHRLAAKAFQQALVLDDSQFHLITQVAVELAKVGDPEAPDYMKRSLDLNPMQVEAAYNIVRSALAKDPENKKVLEQSVDILMAGLEEVRQPFKQAGMDVHPAAGRAFLLTTSCLEKLGKDEAALDFALEWSLRCHADPMAHFVYAKLLNKLGDHTEALVEIETSILQNPGYAAAHFTRCSVLNNIGNKVGAMQACRESIKRYHKAHEEVVQARLAAARAEKQRKKAAQKARTQPRPKLADAAVPLGAYKLLARLLVEAGDKEEALHVADELPVVAKGSAQAHFAHAQIMDLLGEPQRAVAAYETALAKWGADIQLQGTSPKEFFHCNRKDLDALRAIGARCATQPSVPLCVSYNQLYSQTL